MIIFGNTGHQLATRNLFNFYNGLVKTVELDRAIETALESINTDKLNTLLTMARGIMLNLSQQLVMIKWPMGGANRTGFLQECDSSSTEQYKENDLAGNQTPDHPELHHML
jgi:hypothetical protein